MPRPVPGPSTRDLRESSRKKFSGKISFRRRRKSIPPPAKQKIAFRGAPARGKRSLEALRSSQLHFLFRHGAATSTGAASCFGTWLEVSPGHGRDYFLRKNLRSAASCQARPRPSFVVAPANFQAHFLFRPGVEWVASGVVKLRPQFDGYSCRGIDFERCKKIPSAAEGLGMPPEDKKRRGQASGRARYFSRRRPCFRKRPEDCERRRGLGSGSGR